jgi:hypothetical protein
MDIKYTNLAIKIPNGHNLYQNFPAQRLQKYVKIWYENKPSGNPAACACGNMGLF